MARQERNFPVLKRYGLAMAAGGIAAVSLLWVMQLLIATGQAAVTEVRETSFLEFVRVKPPEDPPKIIEKPRKPPEPDEPPPLPEPKIGGPENGTRIEVPGPNPPMGDGFGSDLGDFGLGDGDFLPIFKVDANYPGPARSRGLEGHCDLEFSITPLGTTADVRTIECTNSVFERASIQALLKFKYKPRIVNGTAITVTGLRHRITFRLQD